MRLWEGQLWNHREDFKSHMWEEEGGITNGTSEASDSLCNRNMNTSESVKRRRGIGIKPGIEKGW
jgi:hypothetical protein